MTSSCFSSTQPGGFATETDGFGVAVGAAAGDAVGDGVGADIGAGEADGVTTLGGSCVEDAEPQADDRIRASWTKRDILALTSPLRFRSAL